VAGAGAIRARVSYEPGAADTHAGDSWVVTTTDGTSYYFGAVLPGYVTGDTPANARWTVPVFATASGQPCYDPTFAHSSCPQASEVLAAEVVHGVGERVAFAELKFVPDQMDVVEVGADRLCRRHRPGPPDELDAGVDALNIVVQVGAADRPGADVVVFQLGGWHPPGRQVEALDQAVVVHDRLLIVGVRGLVAGAARIQAAPVPSVEALAGGDACDRDHTARARRLGGRGSVSSGSPWPAAPFRQGKGMPGSRRH